MQLLTWNMTLTWEAVISSSSCTGFLSQAYNVDKSYVLLDSMPRKAPIEPLQLLPPTHRWKDCEMLRRLPFRSLVSGEMWEEGAPARKPNPELLPPYLQGLRSTDPTTPTADGGVGCTDLPLPALWKKNPPFSALSLTPCCKVPHRPLVSIWSPH